MSKTSAVWLARSVTEGMRFDPTVVGGDLAPRHQSYDGSASRKTTRTGAAQEQYVDFGAAAFGRILQAAGDPRIMQFGVKYAF